MGNHWQELWRRKALGDDRPTLAKLIEMVGWKTAEGGLSVDDWLGFVAFVSDKVGLREGDEILEVGCGPGGFLLPLRDQGFRVAGIDYSDSLVAICREVMPEGRFEVAEANALPFDDMSFDVITSNSVFHYFPDHTYTEGVVREMARCLKPGGRGAVLDLNDAAKQEAFMAQRYARYGGPEEYERQNQDLPQLFYDKQWFIDIGKQYGLDGYVEDQQIENYWNSAYRFNYFFEK